MVPMASSLRRTALLLIAAADVALALLGQMFRTSWPDRANPPITLPEVPVGDGRSALRSGRRTDRRVAPAVTPSRPDTTDETCTSVFLCGFPQAPID
jgi:hypothetical protein